VTSVKDVVEERPLFLTSSGFEHKAYGKCLTTLKKRMQLDEGPSPLDFGQGPVDAQLPHHHHHRGARGDMHFLVNVTSSFASWADQYGRWGHVDVIPRVWRRRTSRIGGGCAELQFAESVALKMSNRSLENI
jgi:hypothetical protein